MKKTMFEFSVTREKDGTILIEGPDGYEGRQSISIAVEQGPLFIKLIQDAMTAEE